MSRQRIAQEAPGTDLRLDDFPAVDLAVDRRLVRVHGAGHGPGWFSSDKGGRFDLTAPRGTSYAGDALAVALREALGGLARQGRVPVAEARLRAASIVVGVAGRFAAVSVPEAARFGVTSELTSMPMYTVPQMWAEAFAAAGFDGIRYTARFTPGPANSWAVFGPAGAHPLGRVVEAIPGIEACRLAGLHVLADIPASSALTTLPPPTP
ncbi:RES family NAD+ phosphorylase [Agrococcus citreus]|uniref:RES domain-containing protein n=1 Tax=Agrococcus citreus TaxID=84643 RepID=A0ABP4JJY1_9MICO